MGVRQVKSLRYLIREKSSGEFLATMKDGQPVWDADAVAAMRHSSHEIATRNLEALKDIVGKKLDCEVCEQAFYMKASDPRVISTTPS